MTTDDQGIGDPVIEPLVWHVPAEVQLRRVDGEMVLASRHHSEGHASTRNIPGGVLADAPLLLEFIALAGASDERIRAYAAKWGTLGLCGAHDRPHWHHQRAVPLAGIRPDDTESCYLWRDSEWNIERVEPWRAYAIYAAEILERAKAVRNRERPEEAVCSPYSTDWPPRVARTFALADVYLIPDASPGRDLPTASQSYVWLMADEFLRLGDVRPRPRFVGGDLHIVISGDGLFGALAACLIESLVLSDGRRRCSACMRIYLPERTPRSGERNYCGRRQCKREGRRYNQQQRRLGNVRARSALRMPVTVDDNIDDRASARGRTGRTKQGDG